MESIFRDIRELDREYLANFENWNAAQKNAWSATFFNTVEYLCFIVNHNITNDELLTNFFFDEGLHGWRKLLNDHAQQGVIKDAAEMFPEFKKAHRRMTTC